MPNTFAKNLGNEDHELIKAHEINPVEKLGQSSRPEKPEQHFENAKIDTQKKENLSEGKQNESSAVSFTGVGYYDQEHNHRQKEIEDILSEGLEEIYIKMPPKNQMEFKHKGEEVSREINKMIDQVKIKIKKILNLIQEWLSIVPGINKFYLEQEAKIRTDKIIQLVHEKKK